MAEDGLNPVARINPIGVQCEVETGADRLASRVLHQSTGGDAVLSFLYLGLRQLFEFLILRSRSADRKELEILVASSPVRP
jgi:hypothetical protein